MNRFILLVGVAVLTVAARAQDVSNRPVYFTNLRGGFVFDAPDARVEDKWEHEIFNSYVVTVGAFRTFPQAWRQFYFFGGPEFSYMASEESISGTNSSYLYSEIMQLFLTGGFTWRPDRFGGDWTFSFFTAFEAWGQQQTELVATGYTKTFDKQKPQMRDIVSTPDFIDNMVVGLNACYDLSWEWSGCLNYEMRGPSVVTAGINYGF